MINKEKNRFIEIVARHLGVNPWRLELEYFNPTTRNIYFSVSQEKELYWELKKPFTCKTFEDLSEQEANDLHDLLLKEIDGYGNIIKES